MIALVLALLLYQGQSPEDCRRAAKLGQRDRARACFETLSRSGNEGLRAEGLWGLKDYKAANDLFRAAVKADPDNPRLRVRWGLLLLDRFNPGDASDLFNEALKLDPNYAPAMLGLAMAGAESFEMRATEMAQKAIEKDPKLVEARELLAGLHLEDSDFEKARKEAAKAIEDSKEALDAMAVLAAADLLEDKPSTPWTGRMLAASPAYGEGFSKIARHFVLHRRYEDAIAYYRKAVELDPGLLSAQSDLGINLMRVGQPEEARRILENAYEAGYRNAATANSLKLLDTLAKFERIEHPRFILRLQKAEAELLRPYAEREILRALDTFENKYKFKLPGKVYVEMYPNKEDFSVRTLGLPEFRALGVTFGLSVAMDSPSALAPGSYHWASTLWHELSHVFIVTKTRHRVPRWFTEGIAVHEETATSPDWGDRLTPDIIAAIRQKKLLPVAQLDRGFMRPSYPQQVVVSYFQAGQICDYISERWGWQKLLEMVDQFSQVTTTAQVIEKSLGVKPEDFDKDFLAWLMKLHKSPIENFDEWSKTMKTMIAAASRKEWATVITESKRAKALYPEFVEGGNAYEALVDAYLAEGNKKAAADELVEYARAGGRSPQSLKRLAALQEEAGDLKGAEKTLTSVLYIYPVKDEELHRRLGQLRLGLKDFKGGEEELRALLAMNPADPAAAHYELARVLKGMDKITEAKNEVLAALEIAPGYRPAQRLLLELNAAEKSAASTEKRVR